MDQHPHDANGYETSLETASASSDAMSAVPVNPAALVSALSALVQGWDRDALVWGSGYLAGLAQTRLQTGSPLSMPASGKTGDGRTGITLFEQSTAGAAVQTVLAIVYGSQTGNSKHVAQQLAAMCDQRGIAHRVVNAKDLNIKTLRKETHFALAISTQGDGDPPDDARSFVEDLLSARAPKLPDLKFAVFALGDSSYAKFCETGKQIDERLHALGGTRLLARVDADVDFQTPALAWIEALLAQLGSAPHTSIAAPATRVTQAAHGNNSYATVLLKQRITAAQSTKEIYHLELDLSTSGLHYLPGDSLAIKPSNPSSAVDAVISGLQLSASTQVVLADTRTDLKTALTSHTEITRVHPALLQFWAKHHAEFAERLHANSVSELMSQLQLAELATRYPIAITAQSLVEQLKPIKAREYSIASAQDAVGEEVHITVARVRERREGVDYVGAGSDFLANLSDQQQLEVSVISNPRFRLPADAMRDIIMIGPGTGVAPFRAFVQQRATLEIAERGRSWLFFGNPQFRYDFLYQVEWQKALHNRELTRMDVAFSRDQAEKRYVQHLMLENAAELYQWLQRGAYLYVCGDAKRMAKDVEQALLKILSYRGDFTTDGDSERGARELRELQDSGRYQRDVY